MAWSFVNSTSQGANAGGALTVTKPTGAVDGDFAFVAAELEADTLTWSSVGAGFNLIGTITQTGKNSLSLWWKRLNGDPASWTWTPSASAAWRTAVCAVWRGGALGYFNPIDATSNNKGVAQPEANQTAPSVTTTLPNDLLIYVQCSFNSTPITSTSGAAATLRVGFDNISVADSVISAAGATGTTQGVGAGTQDFISMHVAVKLSTLPAYEQEGFRFRNDDGSEAAATWMASQDTNASVSPATLKRLRMLINVTANDPDLAQYKLQYRKVGDDTWMDVQ